MKEAVGRGFARSRWIFMCGVDSPVRPSAICLSPRRGGVFEGTLTEEVCSDRKKGWGKKEKKEKK